jgi:hypothetical protein
MEIFKLSLCDRFIWRFWSRFKIRTPRQSDGFASLSLWIETEEMLLLSSQELGFEGFQKCYCC